MCLVYCVMSSRESHWGADSLLSHYHCSASIKVELLSLISFFFFRYRWVEAGSGKNMQCSGSEPHHSWGAAWEGWLRWQQRSPHFGGLPLEEEPVSKSCWGNQQHLVQEVVCSQERQLPVLLQEARCKYIYIVYFSPPPLYSARCTLGIRLVTWLVGRPFDSDGNPIVLSAIIACLVLQSISCHSPSALLAGRGVVFLAGQEHLLWKGAVQHSLEQCS